MDCLWVEFNQFGNNEKCQDEYALKELHEIHKDRRDISINAMFHERYCKYCLEGKKIEAMNDFRSTLNSLGDNCFGEGAGEIRIISEIIQKILR